MKLRHKLLTIPLLIVSAALLFFALKLSHSESCPASQGLATGVASMKAVVYYCYGSPDVLEVVDVEMPVAAPHEILVKVEAASVNPLDWHFMRGSPYIMRLLTGFGAPSDPRFGRDFANRFDHIAGELASFDHQGKVLGGWRE